MRSLKPRLSSAVSTAKISSLQLSLEVPETWEDVAAMLPGFAEET